MLSEIETLAKYPFLREARNYISSLNLTLSEIQNHPLYSASIELGRQRVIDALNTGNITVDLSDKLSQELAIISYAIARILANLTQNKPIIQRYAQAESRSAFGFLRSENSETLAMIINDLNLEIENDKIHFRNYLRLMHRLARSDPRWKLVNRIMDSGYVFLNKNEDLFLIKEAIRLRVIEPIDVSGVPDELKRIAKTITFRIEKIREIRIKDMDREAFPPCISQILISLESGEISHHAMFLLGTFLIGIGLKIDDIVRIFSRFPKFNEEKTRYQIKFLSGETGGTRYSCPSCAKIKSYGICTSDCGVTHPINFYKKQISKS